MAHSWSELHLVQCPKCGALHQPSEHAPESCALAAKFFAQRQSLIDAGLWESDNEAAVEAHLKTFEN